MPTLNHSKPYLSCIGFGGLISSGKDTAGKYLSDKYHFHRMPWAMPLKRTVSNLYGIPMRILDPQNDEDRKKRDEIIPHLSHDKDISARILLQEVGVALRKVYGDTWVNANVVEMRNRFLQTYNAKFHVPDTRFKNEVQAIHRLGGKVYEVVRGPKPYWVDEVADFPADLDLEWYETTEGERIHKSEWCMQTDEMQSLIDGHIYNKGDIRELGDRVEYQIHRDGKTNSPQLLEEFFK